MGDSGLGDSDVGDWGMGSCNADAKGFGSLKVVVHKVKRLGGQDACWLQGNR